MGNRKKNGVSMKHKGGFENPPQHPVTLTKRSIVILRKMRRKNFTASPRNGPSLTELGDVRGRNNVLKD